MANTAKPDLPSPVGKGWKVVQSGLEIEWKQGNILPTELIDILCDSGLQDQELEEFVS